MEIFITHVCSHSLILIFFVNERVHCETNFEPNNNLLLDNSILMNITWCNITEYNCFVVFGRELKENQIWVVQKKNITDKWPKKSNAVGNIIYSLYTKSETQKYYISINITLKLNVNIRQQDLTQMHFI